MTRGSVLNKRIYRTEKLIIGLIMCTGLILTSEASHAFFDEVFTIRPVTLTIVDKATGEPLENIKIYYLLKSCIDKNKILFFIPRPDPIHKEIIQAMEEYRSNAQGEVTIGSRQVQLDRMRGEKIYDEQIYINLDETTPSKNKETKYLLLDDALYLPAMNGKEYYTNPDKRYRGFYIRSTVFDMDPTVYGGTKWKILDALWNGKGLLNDKDTFHIKLERWQPGSN